MDDVIDRMCDAWNRNWREHLNDQSAMRAALRAVHDTHRLVPVEPTEAMADCIPIGTFWPSEHCKQAIFAAPDYTETPDG